MSESEKQFVQALISENAELRESYTALSDVLEQKDNDLIKARELIVGLQEQNAMLQEQNATLQEQIKELLARLNMNSTNSSKPPSSDGYKKKTKTRSLREKTGRKPGAQPGHKGAGFSLPPEADEIIECLPIACHDCPQADVCRMQASKVVEKRSVVDVKVLTIRTDYHQIERDCPLTHRTLRGTFPAPITSSKQYGPSVVGFAIALITDGAVSIDRTQKLMHSMTGLSISTGTIAGMLDRFAARLEDYGIVEDICDALMQQPVTNLDETSVRSGKKLYWMHNASTSDLTYQVVDESRGEEGMRRAGFLPFYPGTKIHDCWKPYWRFPGKRGLCNAHILREIKGIVDNDSSQEWAAKIASLLIRGKEEKERAIEAGKEALDDSVYEGYLAEFRQLAEEGIAQNPLEERKAGQRGRVRRSTPRRLAERLLAHAEEFCLFLKDFLVPFDNNQAERDIRHMKTKIKVSGCFRTPCGAKAFAKINSFLSTAKKQGVNVLKAIRFVLEGTPHLAIPSLATE